MSIEDYGKRVVVTNGLYRGISGVLRRLFVVNGVQYAEVRLEDSILVVRAVQLELCDDNTERGAVDEAIRDEQRKRGLR